MGCQKYYWYAHVRKTIEKYPKGIDTGTPRGKSDYEAVRQTLDETRKMEDGEARIRLVGIICWERHYTMDAVARRLCVSTRTAERWWRQFVYATARKMGYYNGEDI